jgi:hypothetical protein
LSPKYLKFSFPTEMPVTKAVRSSLQWKIFNLLPFKYKPGNFFVYLQSKENLQLKAD